MKKFLISITMLLVLAACSPSQTNQRMNIAVITKTEGFRHKNIPVATIFLQDMAAENNWKLHHAEDSTFFTEQNLDTLDLIVFLQTSGNIFAEEQEQAIMQFVENGGGLLTIHTGTITENNWNWYVNNLGAVFVGHPPVQQAKLIIEDRNHPATSFFPDSIWVIEDEWYSFDRNPRSDVNVLISIDESSYNVDHNKPGGAIYRMGDHPLVWYKYVGQGRIFQTALGHPEQLYDNPLFMEHIKGAVIWTAGEN